MFIVSLQWRVFMYLYCNFYNTPTFLMNWLSNNVCLPDTVIRRIENILVGDKARIYNEHVLRMSIRSILCFPCCPWVLGKIFLFSLQLQYKRWSVFRGREPGNTTFIKFVTDRIFIFFFKLIFTLVRIWNNPSCIE